MSNIGDAIRGLYFRKSKQEMLQRAVERVETSQQAVAEAIERVEISQQDSRQAVARIESETSRLEEHVQNLAQLLEQPPVAVDRAIEEALADHVVALDIQASDNTERFRGWYEGLDFSEDWTSTNFNVWSKILDTHGKSFRNGLEIGSFEGRSAVFFLEYLSNLRLTCVDLFEYTDEFFPNRKDIESDFVKGRRFDANMSKYAGRYEKIVSSSVSALANFVSQGRRFDLIYVDGSHYRDDVMIDALLSWKILELNGVLIFDDYVWRWEHESADRPKDAVEYFVYSHLSELKILHKGAQFIVKKVA